MLRLKLLAVSETRKVLEQLYGIDILGRTANAMVVGYFQIYLTF